MSLTLFEVLFIVVACLTNIVQAVSGFAGTVIAMPPSIKLVGYDVARPVLNLAAILICLLIVIKNFKSINLKKMLFIIIFMGIGYVAGFFLSKAGFHPKNMLRGYGAVICFIAVFFFISDTIAKIKIAKFFYPFILILAGILHFLYTSGGPLLIVFAAATIKNKTEFRATLSLVWIILNSIVFGINIADGLFTPHIIFIAVLVIAISFISAFLGRVISKRMNIEMFRRFTYLLLFIAGVLAVL